MKMLRLLFLLLASAAITFATQNETNEGELVKDPSAEAADATAETAKKMARTVADKTREAWNKTKAFLSDVPTEYREGARKRLKELKADIAALKREAAAANAPSYFAAHLAALEAHYKYASSRLSRLPENAKRSEAKRDRLDDIIENLEDHIDITRRGVRDLKRRR